MEPMSQEKREELEKLARPLMKFLSDNYHPHVKSIVTYSSIEILVSELYIPTDDYVSDTKKEPVENPCSSCKKEWDPIKTDECPHCGNVVPF